MKVLHQGLDSRIRVGVHVDVGGVVGLEIRQGGIDQGIVRLPACAKRFLQRLLHKIADAVPDHGAVLLQAVKRQIAD